MGLFRALFLDQNSWPVRCSDWEMGFMVAMVCRGVRVEVCTLRILLLSMVVESMSENIHHKVINTRNANVEYSLYKVINWLLLMARSVMLTLPCCLMNLATASSSS